ncbi:hypothetical protein JJJ17_13915 [Paracoccus caeni]|uniref:Uncharacterized protein n=1 Tax=Paracoccus caeni TaxID=657651 RepID=A0A934SG47_9RHOB|nr:hypothetical protein [Paracoccus caeni]MBK4217028.1 hypothetical protein [Paracoccus caeni]
MGTEQDQDNSNDPKSAETEGVYGDNRRQQDQDNADSKKTGDEGEAPEKKNRLPG